MKGPKKFDVRLGNEIIVFDNTERRRRIRLSFDLLSFTHTLRLLRLVLICREILLICPPMWLSRTDIRLGTHNI